MSHTHLVALLVEADKKIVDVSNQIENSTSEDTQQWIDGINEVIRQLDHIVEELSSHSNKK